MGSCAALSAGMVDGCCGGFCCRYSSEEIQSLTLSSRLPPPGPSSAFPIKHFLLMNRFRFRLRNHSSLLVHAIQMMYRAFPLTHGMSIRDRSSDVGFGEQHGFRQSATL